MIFFWKHSFWIVWHKFHQKLNLFKSFISTLYSKLSVIWNMDLVYIHPLHCLCNYEYLGHTIFLSLIISRINPSGYIFFDRKKYWTKAMNIEGNISLRPTVNRLYILSFDLNLASSLLIEIILLWSILIVIPPKAHRAKNFSEEAPAEETPAN